MRLGRFTLRVACFSLLLAAAAPARADLYGLAGGPGGGSLARYDNAGLFVERVPAGGESADGLAVTPDGWVYVAGNNLGGGTLGRTRVGAPVNWQIVAPGGLSSQYNVPGGLGAGSDGSVYATSTKLNDNAISGVLRYNPRDGSFVPVVNIPETDLPPFQHFNYDVALSPGGDIYLGRTSVGVERYSGTTGQLVGLLIPSAALPPGAREIDFGPDGNLYLPGSAGVDRFDPQTGALIDHFIPNGSGGLSGAFGLSFGGDGLLYVNSPAASSVLRYDATTGAFRDTFLAPAQYQLALGLGQIAWAVPEPGMVSVLLLAAATLSHRRTRGRRRPVATG
jgi:streptogramin lyase